MVDEVKQEVQAVEATVETEVAKKEATFGNTLKDNVGKVIIGLAVLVVVGVVYFLSR